jgi:hypothetical protein
MTFGMIAFGYAMTAVCVPLLAHRTGSWVGRHLVRAPGRERSLRGGNRKRPRPHVAYVAYTAPAKGGPASSPAARVAAHRDPSGLLHRRTNSNGDMQAT